MYLNQSSERNMIDIPGCSERTKLRIYIVDNREYATTGNNFN